MSASLVGSEMCIRDRSTGLHRCLVARGYVPGTSPFTSRAAHRTHQGGPPPPKPPNSGRAARHVRLKA
eukprot:9601216-Alexandrium_andersonii.AAC.1